jgi:hypothetical protein
MEAYTGLSIYCCSHFYFTQSLIGLASPCRSIDVHLSMTRFMPPIMPDPHHHVVDGSSQHRPPPPLIQDTATQQMLQMGKSRLRSLWPEWHIALDIAIGMSSSDFFGGVDFEKTSLTLRQHPPRPRLQEVIIDIGYSPVPTPFIACPHRHDAITVCVVGGRLIDFYF